MNVKEKLEQLNILDDYSMIDFKEYESYVNRNVIVLLKDGQFLYGTFKSYDQYNSITLNFTVQRIFYKSSYAENKIGLIAIRGENIVSIAEGEYNVDGLKKVDYSELKERLDEEMRNV